MNRMTWCTSILVFVEQVAGPAYAVVAPVTSQEGTHTGMSPLDWLIYGSVVIVLVALLVAAIALLGWLIRALFKR